MPSLSAEQQQVVSAIERVARRKRATPMEVKAAFATGIVESNLRNLGYGDADSQGWRQERRSLYPNPTNLDASVGRFFDETRAVRGKYGNAGQLAAAVQRPAAQYRGRYAQVSGQADRLLAQYMGGGAPAAPRAGGQPSAVPAQDQSGGQQLAALLLTQLDAQEDGPRASMGLAAPQFAAQAVMPQGARSLPSSAPRQSPGESLARALTAVRALGGAQAPAASAEAESGVRTPRAPSAGGPRGRANVLELFWQGPGGVNVKNGKRVPQGFVGGHDRHVHVAAPTEKGVLRFAQIAQDMGLKVGEHPKFGGVAPVHVKNSNHFARRAIDVTGDPRKLREFARRIASMAGAA